MGEQEKILVQVRMSKEAIEKINKLKTMLNASTQAEVIRDALSLLAAVEEARKTPGNIVIPSESVRPGRDKELVLPWD